MRSLAQIFVVISEAASRGTASYCRHRTDHMNRMFNVSDCDRTVQKRCSFLQLTTTYCGMWAGLRREVSRPDHWSVARPEVSLSDATNGVDAVTRCELIEYFPQAGFCQRRLGVVGYGAAGLSS